MKAAPMVEITYHIKYITCGSFFRVFYFLRKPLIAKEAASLLQALFRPKLLNALCRGLWCCY